MELYRGNIVYSKSEYELAEYQNSYLAVENGAVEGIYPILPEKFSGLPVTDFGDDVIIPAFSDLHVHAPQYPQRGLAMDELLANWLGKYTFPMESRYADAAFAHAVYDAFVDDLIEHGTLHAAVFGTIHREATGYLLERMAQKGLRGYVGKVNMDKDSPDILCETTENSLRETEAFLERYSGERNVKPILTPRFAPTCSWEVLAGLGRLAGKYRVGVQTHLVESLWEKETAKQEFPMFSCDTEIYERAGLFANGPVIAAHFIFPDEEDIRILKQAGGVAVQCPDATVSIIAGIMRTAALSEQGVRLGLGSDIAGGHNLGIYSQIGRAVQLSKLKGFYEPEGNRAIPFAKAFDMGTRQSGALFGKVGSFETGYMFDALVIGGVSDPFLELTPAQIVERFCYLGETKHIRRRYLAGKEL